mmetsp:Transcript_20392/g.41708  ORF Transcript_20392/g.41708 Transcript_20392/m.41708 type:complete len:250 (+) Transcript_20392:584-1333(+)
MSLWVRHLIDVHVHVRVEPRTRLDLGARHGLREHDQWAGQRQVGEQVAARGEWTLGQVLVQFETHESCGHGRGGGDGGNDAPRLKLRGKLVDLLNAVVARAQVAKGGDEVHMEVGVVVLLELVRMQSEPWRQRRAGLLQLAEHLPDLLPLGLGGGGGGGLALGILLLVVGLDAGVKRRCEAVHGHRRCACGECGGQGSGVAAISGGSHSQHEGSQVGRRHHELHVQRVRRIERERLGQPLWRRPERDAL